HVHARVAAALGAHARVPGDRPRRVVHAGRGAREAQRGAGRVPRSPGGGGRVSSSARISPTAHYTGYVWTRNGLSDPELETVEGRVLFETLRVPMTVSALLGGGTLEAYLLTRHRAIDALLERAIDEGRVAQVVEVAAGLSPRGLRFTRRYGERLTYIEADLPDMVARKRAALERIGSLSERHRVEEVDALREQGP